MSVFVSAGHSEADPGAVGFGRRESDIAVEFRNAVAQHLQCDKVPHQCDGHLKTNLPLSVAAARARTHKIAIEFHCNASDKPTATGCEVLCSPKDNAIAAKICAVLATTLRIRNRGVKPENSGQHKRLAFVQAGGIIVELFFISNEGDLAAYDARKGLAARAVADILRAALAAAKTP